MTLYMARHFARLRVGFLNQMLAESLRNAHHAEGASIAAMIEALLPHWSKRDREYAVTLGNLARLYQHRREYPRAEALCLEAIEVVRNLGGERSPDHASCLNNLAAVYEQQGKCAQAEPLYQQVLAIRREKLGNQHADVGQSLNNLANLYTQMGLDAVAEPLFREALQITRSTKGTDHPDYAVVLGNLGELHLRLGHHQTAEPLCRQAMTIFQSKLGDGHPHYARSLDSLAAVHEAGARYDEAERLLRLGLDRARRVFGKAHPEVVKYLQGLASLGMQRANYQEAARLYQEALAIVEDIGGSRRFDDAAERQRALTSCLNGLARACMALGRFREARDRYERALRLHLQAVGHEDDSYATLLSNLGELFRIVGNYPAAEQRSRRALAISRSRLGGNHRSCAHILNNLGVLYREMGDYPSAERHYREALEIEERTLGKAHPDVAVVLNNLALLLESQQSAEAERLHRQVLDIKRRALGEDHPSYANTLNNLAQFLAIQGNVQTALVLHQSALEIRRRHFGSNHPAVAETLHNLAGCGCRIGQRAEAERFNSQAAEILRASLGEKHPRFAASLVEQAILLVAVNRVPEALPLMQQALAVQDEVISQVFSIGSEYQRMAYLRTVSNSRDAFLSLVLQHQGDVPETVRSAFELVLRRKALGAEALAAQRDAILGGRYPHLRDVFDQITELRWRIAQKLLAGPAPGETLSSHEQTLRQWRHDQQESEAALARQIPEMTLQVQLQQADRRAVALALPDGVSLVEFVRFNFFDFHAAPAHGESPWQPARYLAFVLPSGQPDQVQMIDLGRAGPIDQMVADFRAFITRNPGERRKRGAKVWSEQTESIIETTESVTVEFPPVATELREKVFDPLVRALGSRTHLWLSPDGDLTRLPFEILPDRQEGKLLLDICRISYLATGRDVLRCGRLGTRLPGPAIVASDPDFDLSAEAVPAAASTASSSSPNEPGRSVSRQSRDAMRAQPVERLPGTRIEGQRIAALLSVPPVLDSVLDQSLKAIRSPRILHLATHGFFLEDQSRDPTKTERDLVLPGSRDRLAGANFENPMLRSGLLLAGFNTWRNGGEPPPEAEDGILTAEDVTGMDLLDTELVVLSACETGLGQVHVGEGVFGLRRAFAVAGAKTLVMSLWKVPDEQTQELMVDFYQRILHGEGRAEALRQAQQAIRARYPDPYHWGAFICQGDPGPMRDPRAGTPGI